MHWTIVLVITLLAALIPGWCGPATGRAEYIAVGANEIRLPPPEVSTAAEAVKRLQRGDVTVKRLERISGVHPRTDGPGHRWHFPDGVLLTSSILRQDGEFAIVCWGMLGE
jgi:hypothetical protein